MGLFVVLRQGLAVQPLAGLKLVEFVLSLPFSGGTEGRRHHLEEEKGFHPDLRGHSPTISLHFYQLLDTSNHCFLITSYNSLNVFYNYVYRMQE